MNKYLKKCLSILAALGSLSLLPQIQATTLTATQVGQAAFNAGIRGNALVNAIAIAAAESGFWLEAHCSDCVVGVSENSCGLWQINRNAHPEYDEMLLLTSALYNAQATYDIAGWDFVNGGNWTPWSTFLYGQFTNHLTIARNAAQSVDSTVIRGNSDTVSTAIALSVRPSAGSASVTRNVSAGATGTVLGEYTVSDIPGVSTYRYIWWYIHWDDGGADGWSAEDYMIRTGTSGVLATPQPSLTIHLLDTTVELVWPTNTAGYHLLRSRVLSASPAWDVITNAPATVGAEFRLQLTPTNAIEFYRLSNP